MARTLSGLRVVSFERRQADEMVRLIERRGGEAVAAPAMREVPLQAQHEVMELGERLLGGGVDVLVLLTGVGTRMLLDVLSTRWAHQDVIEAVRHCTLVCRGPKPAAVLKELGLRPAAVAGEPNTWNEVLAAVDAHVPVSGKRVAVQEYGSRNQALLDALRERGAQVEPVTIYRWALPEDTGPLETALEELARRRADVVLFTSGNQVENVLEVARRSGRVQPVQQALRSHVVVASVGPSTSEVLRRHGIEPDVEPEHPKMGHLVAAIADRAPALLETKRRPTRP